MKTPNEYKDDGGNTVRILGMTGLNYSNNENEDYFIDSEILIGSEHDIVLFKDKVRYINDKGEKVLEPKREKIVNKVLEILEANNIKSLLL